MIYETYLNTYIKLYLLIPSSVMKTIASMANTVKITQPKQVVRIIPYLSSENMKHCPIFYTGEIGRIGMYKSKIIPTHKSQLDLINYCLYENVSNLSNKNNKNNENVSKDNLANINLYKFGISTNMYRRMKEHNRVFEYFDMKLIKESNRPQAVEYMITQELRSKNMLLKLDINNRLQREITFFRDEVDKVWYSEMVDYYVIKLQKDYNQFIDISEL